MKEHENLSEIQPLSAGLRQCPFCGSEEFYIFEEPSRDKTLTWYTLQHPPQVPCGIFMTFSNKEVLIEMWNKRVE